MKTRKEALTPEGDEHSIEKSKKNYWPKFKLQLAKIFCREIARDIDWNEVLRSLKEWMVDIFSPFLNF